MLLDLRNERKLSLEKIVYFSPVDWRWIKQRPQFLAECLNNFYEIHVIYPYRNQRKGLQKVIASKIMPSPYFTFPSLGGHFSVLTRINRSIACLQIRRFVQKVKPAYLWLTMPWQIELVPDNYPIIYDCMDDYVAIEMKSNKISCIAEQEAKMIQKATYIFASSLHLRNLLSERYGIKRDQIHLLRNGYSAAWPEKQKKVKKTDGRFRIGYFGTIGRWFDAQLLLDSLSIDESIEYHLFGPMEKGITISPNSRIIIHGVIEHNEIQRCAEDMDAFVMPFKLTEIVQSVDPIKLYEYIYLNRNILCIHYPEIERFEPFVVFYETIEEYIQCLRKLLLDNSLKYSRKQAEIFLSENNWEKRAEQVYKTINLSK